MGICDEQIKHLTQLKLKWGAESTKTTIQISIPDNPELVAHVSIQIVDRTLEEDNDDE